MRFDFHNSINYAQWKKPPKLARTALCIEFVSIKQYRTYAYVYTLLYSSSSPKATLFNFYLSFLPNKTE